MMKKHKWNVSRKVYYWLLSVLCCLFLTACEEEQKLGTQRTTESISLEDVPEYSGAPYVEINENEPIFSGEDSGEHSFETYSELDSLGRCGVAYASVGTDLMPTGERGSISHVKPTGWHSIQYEHVDGKNLYNRCHLIGYQLSGENANEKNLITGTRYMNVDGMLPFENMVADYVKETDHHVLYRVTPVFKGDNLLADGVQMEAYSVEDDGEAISFNDGQDETVEGEIRGNSRSKIYHCPGQAAYEEMEDSKNLVIFRTEKEAEEAGYRKAKR